MKLHLKISFTIFLSAILLSKLSLAQNSKAKDTVIISEIDNELWKPLIKSVYDADYELHESCYHPAAVMVFEMDNKSSSGKEWLEGRVKPGFAERKGKPKTTYLKMRFDKRIHNEESAFETGIFLFSRLKDGIRMTSYIHFEFLITKENGKWELLMENQRKRGTLEDWKSLPKASEIE
jgi:hypothetical protein